MEVFPAPSLLVPLGLVSGWLALTLAGWLLPALRADADADAREERRVAARDEARVAEEALGGGGLYGAARLLRLGGIISWS